MFEPVVDSECRTGRAVSRITAPRERDEYAERNQPSARFAIGTRQVLPDDLKVLDGEMRELQTAGKVGRDRLKPSDQKFVLTRLPK
jgi:hypothetical protein